MEMRQQKEGFRNSKSFIIFLVRTRQDVPARPYFTKTEQVSDLIHGPRNSGGWVTLEPSDPVTQGSCDHR